MKENKNNEVVKYLLENYDIKNANDIAYALKDMFKDTIQTMMNVEFDSSMGYEKSDNKIEKSNYSEKIICKIALENNKKDQIIKDYKTKKINLEELTEINKKIIEKSIIK